MSDQECVEGVELRDYLNVIIKRKKMILAVFFISIIITAIVSFIAPKEYLATAIIQNGFVEEPLLKKSEVDQMIKFYDFLNPAIEELQLQENAEGLKEFIKVETVKDTDFLRFKVEYKDKDLSLKLCRIIVNAFLAQASDIYLHRINLIEKNLLELDNQVKSIQSDIKRTQKLIEDLSISEKVSGAEIATRVILLQNTLPNYYNNLVSLFEQREDLQLVLIKAKEFKLIELIEPSSPVKPNKKLNIAVSAIVSLIFGVFLAFFVEYWEKQK